MKNIIFIAPPAAGKGTQAKILCDKYNFLHISTGNLLRKEALENIDIQNKLNHGELVSDEEVIELVRKEINTSHAVKGYVLDGFPRTIEQAYLLEATLSEIHSSIDYVIYLDVSKDKVKSRILGRLYCPKCGKIYSSITQENMPKKDNECDSCHEVLFTRNDDTESTFEARYDSYVKFTKPLLDYYKEKNILYVVDGDRNVLEIHQDIMNIIGCDL